MRGVFVGDRVCPVEETQEVTGVRVSENLTIAQILYYPQPCVTGDPHSVNKAKTGEVGAGIPGRGCGPLLHGREPVSLRTRGEAGQL